MSTWMPASAIGAMTAATVPGLSGNAGQRDPRLVPVGGDAGDEVAFHLLS